MIDIMFPGDRRATIAANIDRILKDRRKLGVPRPRAARSSISFSAHTGALVGVLLAAGRHRVTLYAPRVHGARGAVGEYHGVTFVHADGQCDLVDLQPRRAEQLFRRAAALVIGEGC